MYSYEGACSCSVIGTAVSSVVHISVTVFRGIGASESST